MYKKMFLMLSFLCFTVKSWPAQSKTKDVAVRTEHNGDLIRQNRELAVALSDMRSRLRQVTAAAEQKEKELLEQLAKKSAIIARLSEELDAIEAEDSDDIDTTTTRRPKNYADSCTQAEPKKVEYCKQADKDRKEETKEPEEER